LTVEVKGTVQEEPDQKCHYEETVLAQLPVPAILAGGMGTVLDQLPSKYPAVALVLPAAAAAE
jgi:hypothetical protein